jgi:predicted AlkP superfamily phosphohydrolase/phosphomutase
MPVKKVIVIGLDGFEPRLVDAMFACGELPNLAALRAQGGYSRVQTTYPALTPAAWSTFATGTNPGGHGIFDFVHRDPKTYYPILSLSRYERKNAFTPPKAVNLRRGAPIWEVLTRAGMPSVVVRCPATYPPDELYGRMLSGVGVPDLRGGLGTSTFYSSQPGVEAQESERVVHVQVDGRGSVKTHLIGPRHPRTGQDMELEITAHLDPAARKVVLQSDGQPKALEVREGAWSDWLKVKFKAGLLQSVPGMLRFYLVRVAPVFELYASPINFDPEQPLFPISSPPGYAAELASKLGTYYTTGMVEDHGGLNNERFGEAAYLEQCQTVMRERTAMLRYELERFKEGFFFCLFDTPDRVAHMFWRGSQNGHVEREDDISPRQAIEDQYRACDAVVGEALRYADGDALFVVVSDHGMSSFERGLNLNTWLCEQGLLSLREGLKPGEEAGDLLRGVDWSRTRAYAVGLGGIYLNLKGREEQGIVEPGEAAGLRDAIAGALAGLPDTERGAVAVRSVLAREQVYRGPYADESPDLVVNFSEGYRVSWGTPLGGVPAGLFEDNERKWSGDHPVDPCLVPGVLFMNRAFREDNARLVDLAPTILAALGAPVGAAMEGNALLT